MIEAPKTATDEVNRILAQANLSRMRGRWHAATEACMDALCIQPDNVTAHSLLGDIYADQGRLDDAIQWYCLALDLQPDSTADRSKLSRAIEDRRRELATPPRRLDIRLVKSALRVRNEDLDRTRFWRSEKPIRVAIFAATVMCLTIVVAWPLVTARNSRAADSVAPGQKVNIAPLFLSPFQSNSSAPAEAANNDAFDAGLLQKLHANTALLGHGVVVTDVQNDPRASQLTVTFLINQAGGSAVTRAVTARNALAVAQQAITDAQPTQILSLTLRAVTPSSTGARLIFVGDVSAEDTKGISPYSSAHTDGDMIGRLANPWWSAAVPDTSNTLSSPVAAPVVAPPPAASNAAPPSTDPAAGGSMPVPATP